MSKKNNRVQMSGVVIAVSLLLAMIPVQGVQAQGADYETLEGWLSVVSADPGPDTVGQPFTQYLIVDENGEQTALSFGENLPVTYDQLIGMVGQEVKVDGSWNTASDGLFVQSAGDESAATFAVTGLEPASELLAPMAAGKVTGSKAFVSILCKFSDVTAEPKTQAYFQNMYSAEFPGLGNYWQQVSYNNINLNGSFATRWYTLPSPRSAYIKTNTSGSLSLDFGLAARDCTAAADADVNFSGITGINLMFNSELDGYAWGGSNRLTLDGVTKSWPMTWEPPWGYQNSTVIAHEMGHAFGLPHSSYNASRVYDNRWDVMSDTWTDCKGAAVDKVYGCLPQGTISYHLDLLGWIPENLKVVAAIGTPISAALDRLALPDKNAPLMVKIPIDSYRFYTVELRRKNGYDVKLPGEGFIIHEVDIRRASPAKPVDVDGDGDTGDDGAIFLAGESFSVPDTSFVVVLGNAANVSAQADGATLIQLSESGASSGEIPSANLNQKVYLPSVVR